jgi:hypothetical protein
MATQAARAQVASAAFTFTIHQWQCCRRHDKHGPELSYDRVFGPSSCANLSPLVSRTSNMPAIKREESLESANPSTTPAKHTRKSLEISIGPYRQFATASTFSLPPPKPLAGARHAHLTLAPTGYIGSSPRKYKLAAPRDSSSRLDGLPPPTFSRLPSRLGPAMATRRVNKTTAARTTTTTTTVRSRTPTLPDITSLTKHIKHKDNLSQKPRDIMDDRGFDDGDEHVDGEDFTEFPHMMIQGTSKPPPLL